jgi:hypothetical protein
MGMEMAKENEVGILLVLYDQYGEEIRQQGLLSVELRRDMLEPNRRTTRFVAGSNRSRVSTETASA